MESEAVAQMGRILFGRQAGGNTYFHFTCAEADTKESPKRRKLHEVGTSARFAWPPQRRATKNKERHWTSEETKTSVQCVDGNECSAIVK